MADNFLEKHREEYEAKKALWMKKKRHLPQSTRNIEKPEDEAL
ncbi:MAG: dehydrogenase [Prevotellaceae bacterium]|nr:dehydrogenase [Prevotella sp.]MDD7257739.1 dehydrogenase [Prevotellaceae bacterium]MDY6130626.1 dehydrogenase [Prevotella sp.]